VGIWLDGEHAGDKDSSQVFTVIDPERDDEDLD
jgi:hypothetical protein